jgi:hypothetical protein
MLSCKLGLTQCEHLKINIFSEFMPYRPYRTYCKIGEGVRVESTDGLFSFDVIVRRVSGTKRYRKADLEVRGSPRGEIGLITVSHEDTRVPVYDGLEVEVADVGKKVSSKEVALNFFKLRADYSLSSIF